MLSNNNSDISPNNTQKNENNTGTPPVSNTNGTQNENSSNIGQGLKPLNPLIVKNPFDDITVENPPNYLLTLHKVLGEPFVAEAIKNDSTSNKIRRLIELQYWTAIKNFSKNWYSLR